jgi:hypothetical protein
MKRPTQAQMQWNIEVIYSMATLDEVRDGSQWYPQAYQECLSLAQHYNLEVWRVAGIVAALSPQKPWSQNMDAAKSFLSQAIDEGREVEEMSPKPNFSAFCNKAYQILFTALKPMDAHKIIRGKAGYKTSSFFLNIIGNTKVVTIDRHALRVACGNEAGTAVNPNWYMPISEAYIAVAKELGIKPEKLQAITWLTYRRVNGITV